MQLIATLNNLERKEEILSLADGVVVYSSDFSSFNTGLLYTSPSPRDRG